MSGWWSLPQAAPILLRHLSAYAELAEQDITTAQRQWSSKIVAIGIAAVAGLFTVLMICVAVVAATWDTSSRMPAIYGLLGVFGASFLIAIAYLSQVASRHEPFFASIKREWAIDRVLLEKVLSGADAEVAPTDAASDVNEPAFTPRMNGEDRSGSTLHGG